MASPKSDRLSLLRPTAVNTVLRDIRAMQSSGRTVVSLMRGEPDFPTPQHITEAAVRALQAGRTNYADNRGEPALREAVAEKLRTSNGLRYDPGSEILVTDGATLGIFAALMAVAGPGDEVLIPDPIYDAYQSPVAMTGAAIRRLPSTLESGRFSITLDALQRALTPRTRVLLLNTPWNPVGTVFTNDELGQIGEFVKRHDLLLISDEIYETITYENHRHVSPAAISPDLKQRCIVINSFSKTYAMTGWRLGYCAAPAEYIGAMLLVLQQSSRGPAKFVQDAGVAALTAPQECVAGMQREYAARRAAVLKAMADITGVRAMPPEGGFFVMLDARETGIPSQDLRIRLLKQFGVAVIHGSAYGESGEGTLRVSFASGGETLSRGLGLLREGLQSL